jgi:hypothetical protein
MCWILICVGYAEGSRCLACPVHVEFQGVRIAVLIDVDESW